MFDPLPVVGGERPPRHPEGDVVLTPRIAKSWTEFDEAHFNGDDLDNLVAWKLQSVISAGYSEERLYDAWSVEDAIQLAREIRWENPGMDNRVILYRVRLRAINWLDADRRHGNSEIPEEIDSINLRGGREGASGSPDDNPFMAAEFVPSRLSESTMAWVQSVLPEKQAEAIRLHFEEGYTMTEASEKVGVNRKTMTRAMTTLRERVQNG